MKILNKNPRSEDGNVLFLILIAVALFAALSYAVTQSSRSSGGGAEESTSLVNSSQITQYPSSVKTSLLRLQVSKGIDVTNLAFNSPTNYDQLNGSDKSYAVFHPDGGNATYQSNVSLGGKNVGPWRFVYGHVVAIGRTDTGDYPPSGDVDKVDHTEIIAVLPGLSLSVCNSVNEQLNLGDMTNANVTTSSDTKPSTDGSIRDTNNSGSPDVTPFLKLTLGDGGTKDLEGQAYGCYNNANTDWSGTPYVYYHVIAER